MAANRGVPRCMVVAGSLVIGFLSGLIYTWSVFVQPITKQLGWAQDQVAMMGNVMLATFCLGATVGGLILPKLGAKFSSLIGAVLFGGGVLVSGFVTSAGLMLCTWGVIAGLGTGILYTVGQYAASAWYPDKRGMVMGIFLAIFGLAPTVMAAPLTSALNGIGVMGTMRILGIVCLVVLVIVSLLCMKMPPAGWVPEGYHAKAGTAAAPARSVTTGEALKTFTFWRFFLCFALLVIPYVFMSSYTVVFATTEKGLTSQQGILIVSIMGIAAFLGRFLGGVLNDTLGGKPTYAINCIASIIACVMMITVGGFVPMAIAFFLMSFGYGGRTPVYGVYPVQQFGPQYASAIYGIAVLSTVATCLIGPMITASAGYTVGAVSGIVCAVIGCVLMVTAPGPGKRPVDRANEA